MTKHNYKERLELKLDKLFSEIVRSKWYCEKCLTQNRKLNAHHIMGRKNKSTRRDINNWICLCVRCHVFNSKFSAHKTLNRFKAWIKKKRWEIYYDDLKLKSNQICNPNIEELEQKVEDLKIILLECVKNWL